MKLAVLSFIAGVTTAASVCRSDDTCSSNWTQKKCCSDFECNVYCNTTRCRTDTCGGSLCAKTAEGFVAYKNEGRTCEFPTAEEGKVLCDWKCEARKAGNAVKDTASSAGNAVKDTARAGYNKITGNDDGDELYELLAELEEFEDEDELDLLAAELEDEFATTHLYFCCKGLTKDECLKCRADEKIPRDLKKELLKVDEKIPRD